jgi:hypothetical protein
MSNQDVLARIRKLLAIAEHPNAVPAEADAATAAAERLIAKYAVDIALLDARSPTKSRPGSKRIVVDPPYRRAFLIGFAGEVGERLAAARREAVATSGDASTAVALRDRAHEVDEAVREQFPHLRTTRTTISDPRGLSAGRQSGAAADLSSGRNQVTPTHGPSLGR